MFVHRVNLNQLFGVTLQIEYTLVVLDHEAKKPRLSLVGPEILQTLQRPETDDPYNHHTKWRPEYASYMIEGDAIVSISVCTVFL